VAEEQIRRWIGEKRLNAHTPVQAEGVSEWKPLGSYPEFAAELQAAAGLAAAAAVAARAQPAMPVGEAPAAAPASIGALPDPAGAASPGPAAAPAGAAPAPQPQLSSGSPPPGPMPSGYGYGYPPAGRPAGYSDPRASNKIAAGVCGIVLGSLGIHKFILGYTGAGLIMLLVSVLTCFVAAPLVHLIGLIEGIVYLTKPDDEFVRTYVEGQRSWF
jgi:TM2 domain-containing membrane protein YozV